VPARARARLFAKYAFERRCVARSLKVALVVGTVLALINHFQSIISGSLDTAVTLQILLTYAVPFSVSTFGSAMQGMQMEPDRQEKQTDSPDAQQSSPKGLRVGALLAQDDGEVGVFEEAEWQWPEDIVMPIQRIMHHPKRP